MNSRGPKCDIWQLIYTELDSKAVGGILTICAAERYSDHAGDGKADKTKFYSSQDLHGRVCKRIAAIKWPPTSPMPAGSSVSYAGRR